MPAQGKCWINIYRMSKQSKQAMKRAKNETKITTEKKYLSYLKRMGTGTQWLVHTTGPGAKTSRMRKGSCLHFWVPESPKLCTSPPAIPAWTLNAPMWDRNNSREKYPRRRLSWFKRFREQRKLTGCYRTPGWVVVGLQSRREKMKVSKTMPLAMGNLFFVFPGFAWGKVKLNQKES